jgi:hypothetical protein
VLLGLLGQQDAWRGLVRELSKIILWTLFRLVSSRSKKEHTGSADVASSRRHPTMMKRLPSFLSVENCCVTRFRLFQSLVLLKKLSQRQTAAGDPLCAANCVNRSMAMRKRKSREGDCSSQKPAKKSVLLEVRSKNL